MAERRVVVTGIGTINPLGNTIETYFSNLEQGLNGVGPITHFDASNYKTRFACEVKNYDPNNYFDRKEARRYDLFTQYALVSAAEAVEDAAFDFETLDKEQCGVIWSSGIGGVKSFFDESVGYAEGGHTPRFSPFFVPRMIIDIAAGFISMKYGFMGPNYSVVSACASSNHAMINAMETIRYGRADVMVVGGSDATVNEVTIGAFNAMQALSTRNDDMEHASSPFDKNRDGFVVGEGAGAFVFEELEHALKRGAKIYCELAGYGATSDAYHITAPDPSGAGAVKAIRLALKDAGVEDLTTVDYINAHGTSTNLNDVMETKAFKEVFGEEQAKKINVSSTKSMTGHLLGAAGALEAAACALAISEKFIPPTINYETPDPECDLNYTPNVGVQRDIRVAVSTSLGFGGHNGVLVFKAAQ